MVQLACSAILALFGQNPKTSVTTWSLSDLFSTSENLPTRQVYVGNTSGFGGVFHLGNFTQVNALYGPPNGQSFLRGWGAVPNQMQPPAVAKNVDLIITDTFNNIPVPPQALILSGTSQNSVRPCIRFRVSANAKHHIVGTFKRGGSDIDFRIFLYRSGSVSFLASKTVTAATSPYNFDFTTGTLNPATDIIEFASGVGEGVLTATLSVPGP